VGGSIAGCAAAVEFARAGCEVSVFERSYGELVGRGAGIAASLPTLRSLIERDLLDADFPFVHITRQAFVGPSPDGDRLGRAPWTRALDGAAMHWGALYRALRRRVPDGCYHPGSIVTDARMADGDTVKATTNAIDLGVAPRAGSDLEAALAGWDDAQTRISQHYAALSRQSEQALIWQTPDLSTLDAAGVETWFHHAFSRPWQYTSSQPR
jgi:choline dehydrogenase-like flavoprotein